LDKGAQQISFCPLQGVTLFQLQMPIPLEDEFDFLDAGLSTTMAQHTGRDDIQLCAVH
jgi:hypothetical protein